MQIYINIKPKRPSNKDKKAKAKNKNSGNRNKKRAVKTIALHSNFKRFVLRLLNNFILKCLKTINQETHMRWLFPEKYSGFPSVLYYTVLLL